MYKRKISAKLAIAGLLFTAIFFSCKKESADTVIQSNPISKDYSINFTLAKTSNELVALRNDPNANIIRTLKDFDATVVLNTPLSKLSQKDLVDFKSNIVFRKGVGVVGLKYGKLQRNLSYDDFAKVLSMFGMDVKEGYWGFSKDPAIQAKLSLNNNNQAPDNNNNPLVAELPKDYIGYYCISIKTCKKSADYICMSGC